MPVLVAVLVALVVAAAVLLVASAVAGGASDDGRGPLRSFRAGLAARRHPDEEQRAAAIAASAEPVDVSLDELLSANAEHGAAYLDVDELGATLHRARERAARVLPLTRRG
ncbi:hypothetical protein [Cellulomonas chitinilytica]|uniref:hypothetical protein n=1 Tax=Cellulomonas chitinilytica TaxID=398759 RepID=UPI00194380C8|nr:hypothetical protein [Cellulomonas chitinilytica]